MRIFFQHVKIHRCVLHGHMIEHCWCISFDFKEWSISVLYIKRGLRTRADRETATNEQKEIKDRAGHSTSVGKTAVKTWNGKGGL